MQPVLVDVDPVHYALDATRLESKISPRTRAVIPVHPFGQPADMGPIRDIARRHDLKLIEDSCETLFARYQGRRVGSLGDIGCFSTYMAHLLVTGVGGMNTTSDPDYAKRIRSLINMGRDPVYWNIDDDDDLSAHDLRDVIARRFAFTSIGHSYRSTELEAALGVAQLEEWEAMIAARQANAQALIRLLAPFTDRLQLPTVRPGNDHVFMMFPLVVRNAPKGPLVYHLEQHGVETRDMLPLTNQPLYQRVLGWQEEAFPVARWINQHGFYIGCHQHLTEQDLSYVAELIRVYWETR
jgi:dTDP-4-amino-4,6-dideoxygalactose transaminase